MERPIRVYVDTSVFGGAFDPEFTKATQAFWDRVRGGMLEAAVSPLVLAELESAPASVTGLVAELESLLVRVEIKEAAYALRRAYLDARVVGPRWAADALHVAVATVAGCRAIVSWNFRHIVNFRKIPVYNGVNLTLGFGQIAIHTPPEVIQYDE